MSQPKVIHLVPNFPPAFDGIGDYAARLSLGLREQCGISSGIVVGDPSWRGEGCYEGLPVKAVEQRSARALVQALGDAENIVVHYVGYGYERRGIPFWVDSALTHWHAANPSAHEIVFFHELWASGPVWGSAFWLGPIQRWLLKRRVFASHAAFTSTPRMSKLLEIESGRKVLWRPIPAAFPPKRRRSETGADPEQAASGLRVLVFGLEAPRQRALQMHRGFLAAVNAKGRLAALTLAGKRSKQDGISKTQATDLLGIVPADRIWRLGEVAESEIAGLFAGHDLLLTAHPACLMCKSTVIMNALAAGCIPVLADAADSYPLTEGAEFLACQPDDDGVEALLTRMTNRLLWEMKEKGVSWAGRHATWGQTTMLFKEALVAG